jgi:hypothetical protein
MRMLMGLGSNGAAVAIWRAIPAIVKYPLIFGIGLLSMAEVNTLMNESVRAPQIIGGEAAKGEAQIDDPVKMRADLDVGLPVTGAGGLVAVKVGQGDAAARTKQAQATADTESMEDIQAKKLSGAALSTTEDIAYSKVQTKEAELSGKQAEGRGKIAEAQMKEAQATAAEAQANAKIASANFVIRQFGGLANGTGDIADEEFNRTLQRALASQGRR